MDDFELQGADGGEERGGRHAGAERDRLDDALLEKLFKAGAEFFRVGGGGVGDEREDLGREARDLVIADGFVLGQGVTDSETVVADEADDVARPSFIDGFAVLAEQFVGRGQADGAAAALMDHGHVALEFAGANADERDAIAVLGVHVGLNLKHEGGELRVIDGNAAGGRRLRGDGDRRTPRERRVPTARGCMRLGRDGILEEAIEEELNPEIVDRAAEVDGGLLTGADGGEVEGVTGAVEHGELLGDLIERVVVEFRADGGIFEGRDVDGGLKFSAGDALEEVDFTGAPIEHATERRAVAEGPDDGGGLETEDGFEFVEEFKGVARGAVALIHERENRDAATTADFEEFAGLRLDALGRVDDHDNGIDCGEDAVGVLGEIFVTGGVEEVDGATGVVELEDR